MDKFCLKGNGDFVMEINDAFTVCIHKVEKNISKMRFGLREYPSAKDGNYFDVEEQDTKVFSHIMNWTASFYTGMAIWAFVKTRELPYLQWLNAQYIKYHAKVFETPGDTMHDLGFLYSLYAVPMFRMTGDVNQRAVALKAADELAKRFIWKGKYIKAWGRMDGKVGQNVSAVDAKDHFFTQSEGLAIIDCMMNLPLLYWASCQTGNPFYRSVAMQHADTTLQYFIRPDGSVYHAFRFDVNGNPIGGCNYCGYSDESSWARGMAWAIYGFAISYRYTGEWKYFNTAKALAHEFIRQSGASVVPVWDFRLPAGQPANEDTSAAAVAACGFLEIYQQDHTQTPLLQYAKNIVYTLSGEQYLNGDINCPGVLRHQNGTESYTIFGDYFYMEALGRLLDQPNFFW